MEYFFVSRKSMSIKLKQNKKLGENNTRDKTTILHKEIQDELIGQFNS